MGVGEGVASSSTCPGPPLFPRQEVTSGLLPSQHTVNELRGSECVRMRVCVCVCVCVCVSVSVRERESERETEREGLGSGVAGFCLLLKHFLSWLAGCPQGK